LDDGRLVDAGLIGGELLREAALDDLELADPCPQAVALGGELGDGLVGLLRGARSARRLRPDLRLLDAGRRELRLEPLDLGVLRGIAALPLGALPPGGS